MSFVLDLSEAVVAGYTPYHSILRAKKVNFCPKHLIFNAVVCLLVLNVLIFLSSQPLERRCSLTKGVSYFLLIFSFSLKWNLATKLISINFFSPHSKQGISLTWKTLGGRGFALAWTEGQISITRGVRLDRRARQIYEFFFIFLLVPVVTSLSGKLLFPLVLRPLWRSRCLLDRQLQNKS